MQQIRFLDHNELNFPPIEQALTDPEGLLAIGGDLSPERLMVAYQEGIFPWFEEGGPILWWSPDPRMALTPAEVRVSRSMRRLLRKRLFRITMDTAFPEVIRHCAALRQDREGTWITPDMQQAYIRLHELGHAHSVEVHEGDALVGGLYGVAIGPMFFGESMFSLRSNVSKIAFIALARQLDAWQFRLIDCQMPTEHLESLGGHVLPRGQFKHLLWQYRQQSGRIGQWRFALDDSLGFSPDA